MEGVSRGAGKAAYVTYSTAAQVGCLRVHDERNNKT